MPFFVSATCKLDEGMQSFNEKVEFSKARSTWHYVKLINRTINQEDT